MNNAKHTPGPWNASEGYAPHSQGQVSSETTGATLALTYNDENGANAKLIAAAPELLAALIWAVDQIGDDLDFDHRDALRGCMDAINKATE